VAVSDVLLLLRAAAAWLASVVTLTSAMLLRADSDGPAPGWPAILLAMAILAAAFWPMTARRRRLPAFAASVIALQLTGHALLLFAATGHVAHSGASGLVCCPSTADTGHGGLSALTANAGWLLLLVQLLVVVVLAVPLQLLHNAFLALARALAAVVRVVAPFITGLLQLLGFRAITRPRTPRPRLSLPVGGAGRHVGGAVQRRGPPCRAQVRSFTPFAPRGACA
jgi:hypothetical protein